MSFTVHAVFDCYKGLDASQTVSVYVKNASKRPVEQEVEDPGLSQTTIMESFIESIRGKEEDMESELLEETKGEESKKTKGKKNKNKKKTKDE